MKIALISGSTRSNSQTLNVVNYLANRLNDLGAETMLVDLNESRLPFYDDTESGEWEKIWRPIESMLAQADGFVFATPEWDGMFSAGLHNLFNYAASAAPQKNTMAHKPAALVGVSSGMGGVYPLAQLRMAGPKNTHYVVSPENLRFANVKDVLVNGTITVDALRDRADYAMKVLIEYAKALKSVRESGVLDMGTFGSGV